MSYDVQINEPDEIVDLKFDGQCGREEHEKSRDEVFSICRDRGFNKIRVDLRTGSMDMSNQELFDFGKSLEKAISSGNIRIAVVIREEDAATNLTVAVAQTREVEIRAFLTAEDARDWLME